MVNTPLALVTPSVATLVSVLTAAMVTPGTSVPVSSEAVPVMRARMSCAAADDVQIRSASTGPQDRLHRSSPFSVKTRQKRVCERKDARQNRLRDTTSESLRIGVMSG